MERWSYSKQDGYIDSFCGGEFSLGTFHWHVALNRTKIGDNTSKAQASELWKGEAGRAASACCKATHVDIDIPRASFTVKAGW